MRCTQFNPLDFYPIPTRFGIGPQIFLTNIQVPGAEMVEDETTEQVFSRKDRKAYRQAVLGQRTAKAKRRNTEREASTLGEEKQTRSTSRSR